MFSSKWKRRMADGPRPGSEWLDVVHCVAVGTMNLVVEEKDSIWTPNRIFHISLKMYGIVENSISANIILFHILTIKIEFFLQKYTF